MSMAETRLEFIGIPGIPLIQPGDDLRRIIGDALEENSLSLLDNDVLVVTSKIVSKAEGRLVSLHDIVPDAQALAVAEKCQKDPREVALILRESEEVSRVREGVLIVRHRLGFVCANAGIDHSNTRAGEGWRLLLPIDPDNSARQLRESLSARFNAQIAVIISDSHGRPFRLGTVGVAIGCGGIPALRSLRGFPDLFGVPLQVTEVGLADEIAAGAGLLLGQSNEGIPAIIVRGLRLPQDEQASARDLIRPVALDLYR